MPPSVDTDEPGKNTGKQSLRISVVHWLKRNLALLPSITWPDARLNYPQTVRNTVHNAGLVLICTALGIAFLCCIDRLFMLVFA